MINWILSIHGKNCDITEDVDIGSDHSKLLAKNMHICHIVYDMTLHAYLSLKQRICTGEYMNILALSQGRICKPPSPPSPQKWSDFYERCGMCWNERNIIYQIFPIFIFRLWGKFIENLGYLEYKNDHNSETKNRRIL